ncbi:MAG TPA: hypothetical protein VJT31_09460 [Rugosimonospora sp.]|nr:hypothetical protein [Rugosimonospora sp.]
MASVNPAGSSAAPRISLYPATAVPLFGGTDRTGVPADGPPGGLLRLGPHGLWLLLRGYYRDRIAWVALLVFAIVLAYGGGAVLFWFHAIYLGEGGPAISPWLHWLLDSTAGFVGLTPALAIIMPLTASLNAAHAGLPASTGRYVLTTGTLFAVITAPGPLLHNALVGRGTWVATQVTRLVGDGRPPSPIHHIPPLVDMAGQVAVGLPTYIALTGLGLLAVRAFGHRTTADRVTQ